MSVHVTSMSGWQPVQLSTMLKTAHFRWNLILFHSFFNVYYCFCAEKNVCCAFACACCVVYTVVIVDLHSWILIQLLPSITL